MNRPRRGAVAAAASRPASLDELRERIAVMSPQLTPRAREAARYVLEHPNDVALSAVAALALASGIAASAFIRMAQSLGFSGYGELQHLFLETLQRVRPPSFRERIRHYGGELALDDPTDPTEMLRAFSQANIVSLEHLRDDATNLALRRAIKLIRGARVVYVLGLRRSYAVAAYLAYALNRVGRPSVHITGMGGAIAEQASGAGPRDLLIAVSFPPYAGDTLRVCEQVHEAGAQRLAITDTVLSPIARDAELVLQVNDAELLGFRSLTSAMCLAQSLAMGLAFAQRGNGEAVRALQDIDC